MIKQDYLLAIIEHFFQLLAKALGIQKENINTLEPELDKIYVRFLDNNREFFLTSDMSDIYKVFGNTDKGLAQTEMLSELFYRELQLFNDPAKNSIIARKLLMLYDYIDQETKEFSMERMNRRREAEAFLH